MLLRKILNECIFFLSFLFLSVSISNAQGNRISGTVNDRQTGEPLPGVNIFLDNTSIGTSTDRSGTFELERIPDGLYTVVVSMIGYEKFSTRMEFPLSEEKNFDIRLKPVTHELGEVVVKDKRPKEWLRDLRRFKEYFLGYTRNADRTEFLNPEVLNFDDSDGSFIATSVEPLIIENRALGYQITFHLEKFIYKDHTLRTDGYSQFTELEPDNKEQKSGWLEERKRAYNGSYRHLIKSLIDRSYFDEGFRIYATNTIRIRTDNRSHVFLEKVDHAGKILRFTGNLSQVELINAHGVRYLRVEYVKEPPERQLLQRKNTRMGANQISWIELPEGKAVIDIKSGNEVPPYRAVLHGYMGWSSRIPDLVPSDYNPDATEIN